MAGCVNVNYKIAINNNKISKQTKAQKAGPRGYRRDEVTLRVAKVEENEVFGRY